MKLVVFDCDGTLVDSQYLICSAMEQAFEKAGMVWPGRAATLAIIGLSVPQALQNLVPELDAGECRALGEVFKSAFNELRVDPAHHEPLYEGAREVMALLNGLEAVHLAIATGKSQRGVKLLLEREGWQGHFTSLQTADDAPSKPHPAMVHQAMAEAGVAARDTIMVGDTSFDMGMARAAGAGAIGVSWGYHETDELIRHGSHVVIDRFDELPGQLEALWEQGW